MATTYPPTQPTTAELHSLLTSPTLIARRLRTLAEQRFVSDRLLTGRFNAEGGAVKYEQADGLRTDRSPEIVRPFAEYPLSGASIGLPQTAEVQKWGQDVPVSDESIKRLNRNPVDRAFAKLVNAMVRQVDSVALAVIASQITATSAAAAPWATATARQIFTDVALAKAAVTALNEGYVPDTVVVDDVRWAYAMAAFVDAGYVSRENAATNPAITGTFPVVEGMTWLASPNLPTAGTVLVVDSQQLGGMADEQLGGPGYIGAAAGVETKSIRDENKDGYLLRARRITVPVVIEPGAGREITGV